MYEVKLYHHCKNWRNGDLEARTDLISSDNFKTKKAAKEFIKGKMARKSNTFGGEKEDYWGWYTGEKWIHENTGEEEEEYYTYRVSKAKVH